MLTTPGMVAVVHSGSLAGVHAHGVRVEVDSVQGLPCVEIVGLPEPAIRESRARVKTAIANSGFELPQKRFVVNLAPADLPKSGASFDLAIAVALLCQCGICAPNRLADTLILGELSLEGSLRQVRGLLAQLRASMQRGLASAIVPEEGGQVAGLAAGIEVYCARTLTEVVSFLNGSQEIARISSLPARPAVGEIGEDLRDVRGQATAKRALEIAAAGNHNILLVGPPGVGKTMLARRLRGLLPPPTSEQALEIATIAGAAGAEVPSAERGLIRPFRAPHHTVSDVALVGGGSTIRPGEVTLSHLGVLFLDELPEFRRNAVEALRPVMESGEAIVARAKQRVVMPARPLVVAAMNPCACGYADDTTRICRCSPEQIQRYRNRISGPLLDRFDLQVRLPPVRVAALKAANRGEPTAVVAKRVIAAQARQQKRKQDLEARCGRSQARVVEYLAQDLRPDALSLLHTSMEKLRLSLRAYVKVLKVSHTIADLAGEEAVGKAHVAEAVQFRWFDREPARRWETGQARVS